MHDDIRHLLEENIALSKENNVLLKKLYKHSVIGIGLKAVWFAIVIGLPFAVYFYILEPYLSALGSSYGRFGQGILDIFVQP